MCIRKNRCFVFQSYLCFTILFLFALFLPIEHSEAAVTPPAVISGRVVRYSSSSQVQGLAGIQVIAHYPVGFAPIGQTTTDANGYYTLNLNLSGWQEIYLCAQDPDNRYVTECYNEHYWLYSDTGHWGEGDKIGIGPNQKISRDFSLCQGGSIPVSIDLPHDHGCVVYLEGTIDYKSKTSMIFPPESHPWKRVFSESKKTTYSLDLADYVLEPEPATRVPIPPGNYSIWVEDIAQLYYDLETSNPFCTYAVNQVNSFLPRSGTATLSCDKPNADPVHFGSFAQAGMIHGIITDPNTNEKTSHLFRVITDGWHGKPDLVIGMDPNHMDPANPQITFFAESETEERGIKDIQVELIPVDNGPGSVIPAKVTSTPDPDPEQLAIYHTGSYGGYAFKFLKPGGYKIRVFSQIGSSDLFSVFYSTSTSGEPYVISLNAGESKQVNFTLRETFVSGKVLVQGGNLANISASLLTMAHEQICFTLVDSSTGEFSFHGLLSGNVIVRLDKDGYGVMEQNLTNLKLGERRNIGTITLKPYEPCQGTGQIHGRVYLDENPQVGLANITVHAMDIYHILQATCSATTDAQGNFTISNLPNSGFILFTNYDSKKVTERYFNEMYKNVTAFGRSEPWCQWEVKRLSEVFQNIDPSHMEDPNILITPVYITSTSRDQEVNIGLSTYNYPYSAGLNLFAYPGTPLKSCDTASEFLSLFPSDSNQRRISLRHNERAGDMMYLDPNSHSLKGTDFAIEAGRGYVFYLNEDVPKLQIPPFTIVTPKTINLAGGRTIVSIPDGPDKQLYAHDVLCTFGDNEKEASLNSTAISHFDSRKGKWRSSTWLWGKSTGDNFKIERSRGYVADIKRTMVWSRD
ncbi:MAG: carboxypeptidase regulatory-like domain-containing protein [bacterium]